MFEYLRKIEPTGPAECEPLMHTLPGGGPLPLVLQAPVPDFDFRAWAKERRQRAYELLLDHGAILFRGGRHETVDRFGLFVDSLCETRMGYEERRSPRTDLGDKVYSSTIYPADQPIRFHNTMSFSDRWPLTIWFGCLTPAEQGGYTPIADCRRVLRRLSPQIVARFRRKGICYVRRFVADIGLSWQTTFQVDTVAELEAHCAARQIQLEVQDDVMCTRQIRSALQRHPRTGEEVWFNQAYHFHPRSLPPKIRQAMLEQYGAERQPREALFGDGEPIPDEIIDEITEAYDSCSVQFPWERGDVLMLDNMLTAHARTPYSGERLVILALGDPMTAPAPVLEK